MLNYTLTQAAEQFVSKLEEALRRMADAIKFLCNGFPLDDDITPQALLFQVGAVRVSAVLCECCMCMCDLCVYVYVCIHSMYDRMHICVHIHT